MNKVILMGRLTRDPETRYTTGENSTAIVRYTLAVDRRGKKDPNGQNADFINCVAFGRSGEFAEKYLKQGTKVLITGRIQTGSYTNREGQKVYTTEIVVEEQEFAESRGTADGQNSNYAGSGNRSSYNNNRRGSGSNEGFMEIPDGLDDELPFA